MISLVFLSNNLQLSPPSVHAAHCFDSIHHQIHDDLLQLDAISSDRR